MSAKVPSQIFWVINTSAVWIFTAAETATKQQEPHPPIWIENAPFSMTWMSTPAVRKPGNKSFYLYSAFRQSILCSVPERTEAVERQPLISATQSCSLPHSNKSRAFVHIDKGCLGKGWKGEKKKSCHSSCFSRSPSPLFCKWKENQPTQGKKKNKAGSQGSETKWYNYTMNLHTPDTQECSKS